MKFESDSSLKRIIKNSYSAAMYFAVFTVSGVFFVPFLVKHYGTDRYGLIALAGFLTQYVGFIAGCIGSSIARFLNVALNKNDWKQANEIYATALVGILILIVCQLPFFALGVWKIDYLIEYPPGTGVDFRILVGCNVIIFFFSLLTGVYSTPIQAANRVDIYQKLGIVSELIRLAVLVILILNIGPKLWLIGVVGLSITCVNASISYYISRRLARSLKFDRKRVVWKWIRPVMNMASWSIVAELGQILFLKTDVWIVNRFIDVKLAGVCAALVIWPNFVQQIAKSLSSLLMPVVMIDYSHGRIARIRDLVLLTTKLISTMSLFVCGGLMLFGGWFLEIWMGEGFRQYHMVLILMLIHFPLTLGREGFWLVFPAFNKMQFLGISNLAGGVLNIILSLLFTFMGFGLLGVVIATGISLIIQRTLFLSIFAARLLEFSVVEFFKIYAPGAVVLIAYIALWFLPGDLHMLVLGIFTLLLGAGHGLVIVFRDESFRLLVKSTLSTIKGN